MTTNLELNQDFSSYEMATFLYFFYFLKRLVYCLESLKYRSFAKAKNWIFFAKVLLKTIVKTQACSFSVIHNCN